MTNSTTTKKRNSRNLMEHAFPVFAVVVVAVVALAAVERVANAAETTNFSAPATGLDPTKTTRAEDSAATR